MGNASTPYGEAILGIGCLEFGGIEAVVSDHNGDLSLGFRAKDLSGTGNEELSELCPARRIAEGSQNVTWEEFATVCITTGCKLSVVEVAPPVN